MLPVRSYIVIPTCVCYMPRFFLLAIFHFKFYLYHSFTRRPICRSKNILNLLMLLLTVRHSTDELYKWKAWQIIKNNMNKPACAHIQVYSET
jgi:hypothetical protein